MRDLTVLLAAALSLLACREGAPSSEKKGPEAIAPGTFKIRLEQGAQSGLSEFVYVVDGRVAGRTKKGHEYVEVDVPAGSLLSKKPGIIMLQAETTCGRITLPLTPDSSELDENEERRLRRSHQSTFVTMKLSGSPAALWFYVDNDSAEVETVEIGKMKVLVPAKTAVKRRLFAADCTEAHTIKTAAGSVKFKDKGDADAAYLLDVTGKRCYSAVELTYTPGGGRPPKVSALKKASVHALSWPFVDFFLEPPPKSFKTLMRQGRDANTDGSIRYSVQRVSCR